MTSACAPAQAFHTAPEVQTSSTLRLSRCRISFTSRLAIVRVMASLSFDGELVFMLLKAAEADE